MPGRGAVVVLAAAALLTFGAGSSIASPTEPAYVAQTAVSIERSDHRGYVNLFFTVTKNVQGSDYPTQLVVSVINCVAGSGHQVPLGPVGVGPGDCTDAGHTVSALSPTEFTMDASLRNARLRTTWLGKPLSVEWTAARVPAVHSTLDSDAGYDGYFMYDELAQRATAVTRLLGQKAACRPWTVASLETAAHGVLIPTAVQHPVPSNLADLGDLRAPRIRCT
jgi:hypothetical protein